MAATVATGRHAHARCQHSATISGANSDRDDGAPVVLSLDPASADAGETPTASPTLLRHGEKGIHLFAAHLPLLVGFPAATGVVADLEILHAALDQPWWPRWHWQRNSCVFTTAFPPADAGATCSGFARRQADG